MTHWPDFQPHLACNLKTECASGEDEQGCRHQTCGQGGFVVEGRCYVLGHPEEPLTFYEAREKCINFGGYLASFNTRSEMDAVIDTMWSRSRNFDFHVGLTFTAPNLDLM